MNPASANYTGRDHLQAMEEARNYNRHLYEMVTTALRPKDRVVDFGAGLGTFSLPLRAAGTDVVCIEPDAALAGALKAQGLTVYHDVRELADESVDYLFALNVLEHLEDDVAQIAVWSEKLRHGGRVTVYVPAFPLLYSAMDRAVGHFRRYRLRPLVDLAMASGLVITEARYVDSLGFLAAFGFRFLGNANGDLDPAKVRFYDSYLYPLSRVLDTVAQQWFGKNLLVNAYKP